MKILVIHNSKSEHCPVMRLGGSPLLDPRSWPFSDMEIDLWRADNDEAEDVEYDIVLVYNAINDYLGNRFSIKGRPWTSVLSFRFDDTNDFYASTVPMHDMGIDAVFTNCRPFVELGAPHMPVKFMWPPTGYGDLSKPRSVKDCLLCAYISSVEDRDFSLLEKCYQILVRLGYDNKLRVFAHPRLQREKLPRAGFTNGFTGDLESLADVQASVYIPTPRVSDILVGAVDAEMTTALAMGLWPVLIRHRKFTTLQRRVHPIIDSMQELEALLGRVGECSELPHDCSVLNEGFDSMDAKLVDSIVTAYRRRKGAAAGGN